MLNPFANMLIISKKHGNTYQALLNTYLADTKGISLVIVVTINQAKYPTTQYNIACLGNRILPCTTWYKNKSVKQSKMGSVGIKSPQPSTPSSMMFKLMGVKKNKV
jgi:hypothetical protein